MTLGWREGVIGLIVLVALYMLFVVFRMRHLAAEKALLDRVAREREPAASVPVAGEAADDDVPTLYSRPEPARPAVPEGCESGLRVTGNPPPSWANGDGEVHLLREEVAMLRSELAALRTEMQHELGVMRATQTVSPIYGDAMQLALSGYAPAQIAERCGIARAEAELVAALARNRGEEDSP